MLSLRCCTRAFSSCGKWGATLRCGVWASYCGGFSCCGAQALGAQASVVAARRLSSCTSWALERRLSSCGTRASLLRGMWDLPRPGIESVSPELAGAVLTTVLPGKSQDKFSNKRGLENPSPYFRKKWQCFQFWNRWIQGRYIHVLSVYP